MERKLTLTVGWTKSSFSSGNANCLEFGVWTRPSLSQGTSNCFEATTVTAADLSDALLAANPKAAGSDVLVLVRDSKLGDRSPVLVFTRAEWERAEEGFKADEFAIPV